MCLLRRMRGMLDGGGLLIGVDLVKDPARLHAAYNDAAGVTAAVQQESAGAGQSRTGRRFRSGRLRPLCALQSRGPSHRDVSGQPQAPEREPDGPAFRFRRRRSHPYRGQPQIHDRSLSARWRRAPASGRGRYGPIPSGSSRCTGWKAEAPRSGLLKIGHLHQHGMRRFGHSSAVERGGVSCTGPSDLNRPGESPATKMTVAMPRVSWLLNAKPGAGFEVHEASSRIGRFQPFNTCVAVLPKKSSSPGLALTPITIMAKLRRPSFRIASGAAERGEMRVVTSTS